MQNKAWQWPPRANVSTAAILSFSVPRPFTSWRTLSGEAPPRGGWGTESERATFGEFGTKRNTLLARQKHRVTEMLADAWAGKHMRKEEALVDLRDVLVALPMSGLRGDLSSCRDQSRNELRRGVNKVVEAPERRAAFGQAIVDRLDMSSEEGFARRVRVRQQCLRSHPFRFVPPRLRRQPPKESRRAAPEGAVLASVGLELASRDREGLGPFPRVALRQAGGAK